MAKGSGGGGRGGRFAIGEMVAPANRFEASGNVIGRQGKNLILRSPWATPSQMSYRFAIPARGAIRVAVIPGTRAVRAVR